MRVDNRLPQPTAVHWHGLAIRNDMDGVPNLTQPEIAPGAAMDYEFALPRPGTYFYHAHHGVQRERGLYGPLIIDDPQDPTARPGQRARIRLINASGERYDLQVTLGEGAFPLVALAEGKGAQALGVVRTAGGAAPPADVQPAALTRQQLTLNDLQAPPEARLDDSATPTSHDVFLTGDMSSYGWRINAESYDAADPFAGVTPLGVRSGERVRLALINQTPAFHPMHLHGHTAQVRATGLIGRDGDTPLPAGPRKDTVQVAPGRRVVVDFAADNPGQWLHHCHNAYHLAAGMATVVSYQS